MNKARLMNTGSGSVAILTTAKSHTTFRLQSGMTAGASLRQQAAELERKAERYTRLAQKALLASDLI